MKAVDHQCLCTLAQGLENSTAFNSRRLHQYFNAVFANPGHSNRWICLKLAGKTSNRPGIGARIKVVVKDRDGRREIHRVAGSGGSFGASPLRQEIGLGAAHAIDSVEVRWPI